MKGTPHKLPIKTDLFNFVTFRSPEQLKYDERNIRFVIDNSFGNSSIATAIEKESKAKSSENFKKEIQSLSDNPNVQTIRNINPSVFDFANNAYKSKSSVELIYQQSLENINSLTLEEVNQLFQELYYQIFTNQSTYVRQAITQMLIVNMQLTMVQYC